MVPFFYTVFLLGLSFIRSQEKVWDSIGFGDFMNSRWAFHKHADLKEHLKCVLQSKHIEMNLNSIHDALQESAAQNIKIFNENVRLNRILMTLVVTATRSWESRRLVSSQGANSMVWNGHVISLQLMLLIWKPVLISAFLALQRCLVGCSKTINLSTDYVPLTSPTQKYTPIVILFVHWWFKDPLLLPSPEQKSAV